MSERGARVLARAIFAFVLLELVVSVTFAVLDIGEGGSASIGDLGFVATVMLFPIIGLLLASRRPRLQGMADRLAALDGSLEIRTAPGAGTVVMGRIPVGDVA